jgi:hypothetical protein
MKKNPLRDRNAWAYRMTKVTGPHADESPQQVGALLLYDENLGPDHHEFIWDDNRSCNAYNWSLERVGEVQVKDGKVEWPGGKCPC